MSKSDSVEETEYEKELANVYGEQWDYYESNIIDVENQVIDEAKASNDDSVYQGIGNDVNLGYQKSFSEAGRETLSSLSSQGVDPSSGKAKSAISSLSDIEASVKSDSTARSEVAGQERYITNLSNVMAMGQGESQEAVSSLSDIAASSQEKAISEASIAAENKSNIESTVGAVAGGYASHSTGSTEVDTDTDLNV